MKTLSILLIVALAPMLSIGQTKPGIFYGGSPPVVNPVPPPPDIAWYKFNENAGTVFIDTIHAYNGVINRSGQWEPGKSGSAITNNGTADFANTTNNVTYGTNTITVSLWVFLVGPHSSTAVIAESSTNFNNQSGSWIILDSGDTTTITVSANTSANGNYVTATFPLPSNAMWHNVLVVFNCAPTGGAIKVYVDGSQQFLNPSFNGLTTDFTPQPLFLASRNAASLWWFGGIDDLRIFSGDQSALATLIFNNPQ